jgi:hypothetical protein
LTTSSGVRAMLVTSRERLGRRIGVAVSPYRMPLQLTNRCGPEQCHGL